MSLETLLLWAVIGYSLAFTEGSRLPYAERTDDRATSTSFRCWRKPGLFSLASSIACSRESACGAASVWAAAGR